MTTDLRTHQPHSNRSAPLWLVPAALIAASPVRADPAGAAATATAAAAATLGEHPSIVARRVIAAQGYDYASKFYPHPAWLYLSAEAPHPMTDHPAVIVFRRAEQERLAAREMAAASLAKR